MSTSSQPPYQELLDVLNEIARGLTSPKPRALATEVPVDIAANHLDYLAIQEMIGRLGGPNDREHRFVYEAQRLARTTDHSTVTMFGVPADAVRLAVFTTRDAPAETVDPASAPKVSADGTADVAFDLTQVENRQPIIRLELQRADGYPIALGPRLPAL